MLTVITGQQFTSQYKPSATKKDMLFFGNTFTKILNGALRIENSHDAKFLTNKFTQCKSNAAGACIWVSGSEGGEATYNCFLKNANAQFPPYQEGGYLGTGFLFRHSYGSYVAKGNAFGSCPDETGFGQGVAALTGVDNMKTCTVEMRENNFTDNKPDKWDAVYVEFFDTASIIFNTYYSNTLNSVAEFKSGNTANFDFSNIVENKQMKVNDLGMINVYKMKVNANGLVCISNVFNKASKGEECTFTNCKFYMCDFSVPVETVAVQPKTNTLSEAPFDLFQCAVE